MVTRLRSSVLTGLAMTLAITGAACTPDGTPTTPASPSSSAAASARVTLAVYGPPPVIAAYTSLVEAFTDEASAVDVELRAYDDHDEAMRAYADPEERADVFLIAEADLADLQSEEQIQPVDELLIARGVDFGDGVERAGLESFSADSRLQCMPTEVSPQVVYVNRDLVRLRRAAGPGVDPPNTVDGWDLETFTRAARQASGPGTRGVHIDPSLEFAAPFVLGAGGTIVDDVGAPTTLTLSAGADAEGMMALLDLMRDPRLTYSRQQLARRDAVQRFRAGKLGMLVGYRDQLPGLARAKGLDLAVMPLPSVGRRATVARINGLCLSADTANVDAAADLIADLAGPEAGTALAATGYLVPASVEALRSPSFAAPDVLVENGSELDAQAFTGQLRYLRPRPHGEVWQLLVDSTRSDFEQLFFRPVLGPLEDRLTQIDEDSADLLAPAPVTPSASAS